MLSPENSSGQGSFTPGNGGGERIKVAALLPVGDNLIRTPGTINRYKIKQGVV